MRILISGASGFIGSILVPHLQAQGHTVLRLVRNRAQDGLFWSPLEGVIDLQGDEIIDAAINLSGDNLGQGRWTKAKKKRILSSRIRSTSLLAGTLAGLSRPPQVLLSSSGIGFYGSCGDAFVNEDGPGGKGFLAETGRKWESAALAAQEAGIRVVYLRISPVLSRQGGMLQRLLPFYKFGLGAVLGSGRQYMSWIAIDDLIAAIVHVLCRESLSGPVNLCAPYPVTNREFTEHLNRILKRPTLFRIPAFLLRALFGEMADEEFLASLRAVPDKLIASGFEFQYPGIEEALRHELKGPPCAWTVTPSR